MVEKQNDQGRVFEQPEGITLADLNGKEYSVTVVGFTYSKRKLNNYLTSLNNLIV